MGQGGSGKTFLTLDDKERREDSLKDLRALLDWIETQPNLDGRNVVLRGDSYGGFLALSLAATDSTLPDGRLLLESREKQGREMDLQRDRRRRY